MERISSSISYLRARDPSIVAGNVVHKPFKRINLEKKLLCSDTISEECEGSEEQPEENTNLQIHLRLKRTNDFRELYEIDANALLCKIPEGAQCIRSGSLVTKIFRFSKIFPPDSQQDQLFNNLVKPKMLALINGQNSTLLTYGASGSGKTYTIVGTAEQPGLVPRALEYLFKSLPTLSDKPIIKPTSSNSVVRLNGTEQLLEKEKLNLLINSSCHADKLLQHKRLYGAMQQRLSEEPVAIIADDIPNVSLSVWVSFAEIYNELVYDLLTPQPARTQARKRLRIIYSNGNAFIKDLTFVSVTSGLDAFQLLHYGLQSLKYAATTINDHSSRSHSIFTIKLVQAVDPNDGNVGLSSFNFCDLAGSERLKKTGNIGDRLKESNNINTSLLVLGRCIKAIRDNQKAGNNGRPIPFRESKLTQLFQRALSNHETICMIVNINPTREAFDESQHVLNFSAIAKEVTVEQPQLKRPENRFSEYIEAQKMKAHNQEVILSLQDQIEHLKNEVVEEKEYAIRVYKDIVKDTKNFYEQRCTQLEKELSKLKRQMWDINNSSKPKRKKMSVIVLDSSDEESSDTVCPQCIILKKSLDEANKEKSELKDERNRLQETLDDGLRVYKDLEMLHQTEAAVWQKKIIELQDEVNSLIPYRDNVFVHDDIEDAEFNCVSSTKIEK